MLPSTFQHISALLLSNEGTVDLVGTTANCYIVAIVWALLFSCCFAHPWDC